MDLLFWQRENGRIQHSHPDLQAGTLLRASQPIFFLHRFPRCEQGRDARLAHGVASSGREACPNTYRHPEGVRTYTSLNHSW
jgi:hypothetical protein